MLTEVFYGRVAMMRLLGAVVVGFVWDGGDDLVGMGQMGHNLGKSDE